MPGVRTTHHVRIGPDYFLTRPGTFRKRPAPMFGPRFTTGDPDYSDLSLWQYWVQRCWVGGMGATEWEDDAMFDQLAGVDTSHHDLLVLSRDLQGTGALTAVGGVQGTAPRQFFVWKNTLYCLNFGMGAAFARLWRWSESGGTWTSVRNFGELARSMAIWRDRIYFGDQGPNLTIVSGSPGSESFGSVAKPAGEADVPYAMAVYKDRLYVGFGQQIWRMKGDGTWDGSTPFYTDRSINYVSRMEVHQGFLYMATQNGHILRTDGNNTFDMWQFEPGQVISSIRSFDGRLFVGVMDSKEGVNNDPFSGGATRESVLYQFSGASVTELKRWGRIGRLTSLGHLRVWDGRLWFGASDLLGTEGGGFGVGMYDPREDAYHLVATNRDTVTYPEGTDNGNWQVEDVFLWNGYIHVAVRGFGGFRVKYSHRDMARAITTYDNSFAGGSPTSKNGGWIESSDFDAGTPGLAKQWNAIILDYDLPNVATHIIVDYSTDRGQTWTTAATLNSATPVFGQRASIKLWKAGTPKQHVKGPRFKWRLTLRTTSTSYSPIVRGVSVRYLPIPDPGWMWDMTLVLADNLALLDGTTEAPDIPAVIGRLRTAFRNQDLVYFVEPDGTSWASGADPNNPGVLIHAMEELVPHIGPATVDGVAKSVEYEVRLTLLEAVDAF